MDRVLDQVDHDLTGLGNALAGLVHMGKAQDLVVQGRLAVVDDQAHHDLTDKVAQDLMGKARDQTAQDLTALADLMGRARIVQADHLADQDHLAEADAPAPQDLTAQAVHDRMDKAHVQADRDLMAQAD
jgi:hypothetical protein